LPEAGKLAGLHHTEYEYELSLKRESLMIIALFVPEKWNAWSGVPNRSAAGVTLYAIPWIAFPL
jgi:hypothetical protein